MELVYVDQVEKLDTKKLMAKVLKTGRTDNYRVTMTMDNWPQIEGQQDSNQLTIDIELEQLPVGPANAPLFGQMLLKFTLPDGGKREQMLPLTGKPASKASWRWKTMCPLSEGSVQTLYFRPSAEQFQSLKVSGLKYRRKLSEKGYRHLDRMLLYLRELGAKNLDPFIPKPLWMTQARYEFLLGAICKEHTRALSAALGLQAPEFHDEYKEVDLNAKPQRLPVNDPQSLSMYYRDKHGALKIKAKLKKRYGLPEGA